MTKSQWGSVIFIGFTPVLIALLLKCTPYRWTQKLTILIPEAKQKQNESGKENWIVQKIKFANNAKINLDDIKSKFNKNKNTNANTDQGNQLKEALIPPKI